MNSLDWIGKWADYTPSERALTSCDSNESYTYSQLDRYAGRLVEKLTTSLNINEGDRVAVLAEHGLDYIVLFCACQRIGAILVPLNYRMSAVELQVMIKDAGPKLLLYSDKQVEVFKDLELEASLDCIKMSMLNYYYKQDIVITPKKYHIKEHNPLFIFYTSGTTGKPKGVIYTNKMMFWNSLNTSMRLGITFKDATLNTLPPYHTSGWHIFVTTLLHKGAHVYMLEKFDAEQVLCLLELNKITLFIALPTMLIMMQKTPVFDQVSLKKIRFIITGGENIPSEMVKLWYNEKKIFIRPGYGLTEAGPSVTSLHHNDAISKPNSIGKPNFYLDIKIVNDKGEEVRTNEIGELCIKGEIVTPGYWNSSAKTHTKIKDGWLYTGDYVCKDIEGFLYLKGRKHDMYISGGENIYPKEVEIVLKDYKYIKESVVFSVKDEKWGQCGVAFVTITQKSITKKDIRTYLKKHLVSFKHPKYLFILEEIPLTSVGKVSRKKLINYFNAITSSQ